MPVPLAPWTMNKQFSKINIFAGWGVFLVALVTYVLTIEPTTSLWDCAEFIATSYKLEIGHPPGTPFFFLINRLGAMFAADTSQVAFAVNVMSALESALTIAFMYWSIVMLGAMIVRRGRIANTESTSWALVASGVIGSLAYAWTDTFWFSAVEAEVYALSSLFTAVVFWAMLKWEKVADQPSSSRWLIFIAYMMGLSIGAHILNLLAIPALSFIYYFKKFPQARLKNLWKPAVASILLTGVFYLMTPTVVGIGGFVDRIFVNSFGLPVNSGLATVIFALVGALAWGVWWSHKKMRLTLNLVFLGAIMVVIGFSSYAIVLIRSSANPPMNSNHPDNPYALRSFLNRDQYGAPPLLYGPTYGSRPVDYKMTDKWVLTDENKYEKIEVIDDYVYDDATMMFFPRMYDGVSGNAGRYLNEYKNWGGDKGRRVRTANGDMVVVPTFGENLNYFFGYQISHMYLRYFFWNFVGRQSDIQSTGNIDNGSWLSGIDFIDEAYLGPQDELPSEIANNRGRNTYFFLPFILGMIGLIFHVKRDGRGAFILFTLFFMTGIAIILYLNQSPLQPRERDYAYAGSFYAFAIWIGVGVLAIYEWLRTKLKTKASMAVVGATALSVSVPTVLVAQNWDDHDRSGRTISRDMGFNYLDSALPNAILINYGDNDAFPVWYAQEVEGYRTDVRPMNFSYITGDWYIDQMKIKSNESDPVPFTLPYKKYYEGAERMFPIQDVPHPRGGVWTAQEVMTIVNSDAAGTKLTTRDGRSFDFVPTRRIAVPVNKQNALEAGILTEETLPLAQDTIYIEFPADKQSLSIDEMLFVDLMAHFDWKRPIYMSSYSDMLKYGLLDINKNPAVSYLRNDGVAYLLTPVPHAVTDINYLASVDTERLWDNLMNKFNYGNIKDTSVYADTFVHNTLEVSRLRNTFAQLADALMAEGDTVRAVEALDRAMVEMPASQMRFDSDILSIVSAYWRAGELEKGDALARAYGLNEGEYLDYYSRFTGDKATLVESLAFDRLRNLYGLVQEAMIYGRDDIFDEFNVYTQVEKPTISPLESGSIVLE